MKLKLIAAAVCIALLSGCAAGTQKTAEEQRYVFAMDTEMTLKAYGRNAQKALDESEKEIKSLDKTLDRGDTESEVYKINRAGSAQVSNETAQLTETALKICEMTGGAFDITVAPAMDLWGFYTRDFYVPNEEELSDVKSLIDYSNVTVNGNSVSVSGGSQIDLGGIAKGWLSERIMDIMKDNGVNSGIISLGGNVCAIGEKPDGGKWRVAIQNPDDTDSYLGIVQASDTAVITSGGYQRFFERDGRVYHHIIDPKTAYPADSGLKSVSIITPDASKADGLSTALFVMGKDKACEFCREHSDFDAVLMSDDNKLMITKGIADYFDSTLEYEIITNN